MNAKDPIAQALAAKRMQKLSAEERQRIARLGGLARQAKARKQKRRKQHQPVV